MIPFGEFVTALEWQWLSLVIGFVAAMWGAIREMWP
jgi:hypothetical protein